MTRRFGSRFWLAPTFAWLCATASAQAPTAGEAATTAKAPPGPAPNAASAPAAQEPKAGTASPGTQGKGTTPRPVKTTERNYRGPYDAGTCRDLFRSCDQDADDRLDVFEASTALDGLRDARDIEGFARLDTDRDGFVTWTEFDATFRRALQQKGAFRVRASRPLGGEGRGNSELQQFLRLYDADHDGALDPTEVDQLLRLRILPQGLGARLRTLDHDGSGRLEEAELAPWFEQLPRPQRGTPDRPGAGSLLPPPWNVCDADKDNTVAFDELALALRKLDPTLQRWVAQLLAKLDQNGDGQLQPAELPAPPPAGPVNPAPPLPKESTLR